MKMLMGREGWAGETMLSGRIEGVAEYWSKEMTRGSGKGSGQEDIPEYFFWDPKNILASQYRNLII